MGEEVGLDALAFEEMSFYRDFQSLADPTALENAGPALKKMEYKPAFTHPGKIPADFTHDFGSSSSSEPVADTNAAGSSSATGSTPSSLDTILVCAKCLDPLVIGGRLGEATDTTSRRLWALRCGHILDGKCIGSLMKPDGEQEQPPPPPPEPAAEEAQVVVSPKGKGKARQLPSEETPVTNQVEPSIRRLRSGRAVPCDPNFENRPVRQKKGKAKVQVPRVEKIHEWRCPVSGCGRVHQSVFVDGHWKTDEKAGAIMMFV